MTKKKKIIAAGVALCIIVASAYAFTRHQPEALFVYVNGYDAYIDEHETPAYEAEEPMDMEVRTFTPAYIEHDWVTPPELAAEASDPTHGGYSWIMPPVFDNAGQFSGGLAVVSLDGKWGAVNTYGEVVLPIIFETLASRNAIYYVNGQWYYIGFGDVDLPSGFFSARLDGKWGVIDTEGRVIIPFEFDRTFINFEYEVVTVRVRESMNVYHTGLFDLATGRELVPIGTYSRISFIRGGFAHVTCYEGLYRREGVININTGHEVVPLTYGGVVHLSEGFSAVTRTFGWGIINTYGEGITPFIYNNVMSFSDDIVLVRRWGLWGAIDFEGNYILTPKYNAINRVHMSPDMPEGLALVFIGDPLEWDGLWGILDVNSNEIIVPVQHRDLWIIGENLALATADYWRTRVLGEPTSYTLIDITDGREIATGTFDFSDGMLQRFHGNFAIFTVGEAGAGYWRHGLIDRAGKEILPPIYYSIRHLSDDLLIINDSTPIDRFCHRRQGRLINNTTWEEVLPWHDFIGELSNGMALINIGGSWLSPAEGSNEIVDGYWGFIDDAGQIVIPPVLAFERVQSVSEDIAAVQRDGKWGFIRIY